MKLVKLMIIVTALTILLLTILDLPSVRRYIKKQTNQALITGAKLRYAIEGLDN